MKLDNFDDNNEKNLIKNILQLENKSVEDVMVPRGEIISIDKKQNYNQILELLKMSHIQECLFMKKILIILLDFFI